MYSYWRARTSSGGCSWVTQGPPVATVVSSTVCSTVTNWVTNLVSSLVEPRFSLSLVSLLAQPTKNAAKATTTQAWRMQAPSLRPPLASYRHIGNGSFAAFWFWRRGTILGNSAGTKRTGGIRPWPAGYRRWGLRSFNALKLFTVGADNDSVRV